uniref:Decapping nuclease n=1 Tax=Steinernema glaseri TaxID=37863 RepID=A0A1I7YPG2_9BILA
MSILYSFDKKSSTKPVQFRVNKVSSFTYKEQEFTFNEINAPRLKEDVLQSIAPGRSIALASTTEKTDYPDFNEILMALYRNADTSLKKTFRDSVIVASRGALSRVAAASTTKHRELLLQCCYYKKILFITRKGSAVYVKNARQSEKAGQSFEALLLDRTTEVELGALKMYINCEVDGIDRNGGQIELKSKHNGLSDSKTWEQCSAEWFMQAKLAATQKIIVGDRRSSNIANINILRVEELHNNSTAYIRNQRKAKNGAKITPWKENYVLRHLLNFLLELLNEAQERPAEVLTVCKAEGSNDFVIERADNDLRTMFTDEFLEAVSKEDVNPVQSDCEKV